MHVVMGVKPGEPRRLLDPTPLRHMHAEVEVFVEEVIEAKRDHPAKEKVHAKKVLNPKKQGGMQADNQGRVPPGEADLFQILLLRQEIGRARTEDAMVNQGMGSKRVRPDGLVH